MSSFDNHNFNILKYPLIQIRFVIQWIQKIEHIYGLFKLFHIKTYSKTCVLMTTGSLMKVESIAEYTFDLH